MRTLICFLLLASFAACTSDETGDANVDVSISALSASDVAKVRISISGTGMSTISTTLTKSGTKWIGVIGQIPVGINRTFTGEAEDAGGGLLYAGTVTGVQIKANQTALVALVLQEVAPPPPFMNTAPRITSLWLTSNELAPGEPIDLEVQATDANGDALSFEWVASGGSLLQAGHAARFSASVDGAYDLTAKVTDVHGASDSIAVTVNVRAGNARGSASVSARVNTFPRISRITSTLGHLEPGVPVYLQSIAFDPDGDAVTIAWASTCAGTLDPSPGDQTVVRFILAAGETAASCSLTASATDVTGAAGEGSLDIAVAAAMTPQYAPIVDSTFQSSASADSEGTVILRATGHAHDGGPVTITWSASAGEFSASAGTETTWTAPGCFTSAAQLVARLEDGAGNTLDVPFTVMNTATQCALFRTVRHYGVGTSGFSRIATGDFSGDGILDLAVTDDSANKVGILLGTGAGAFGAATYFATGSQPQGVATGDFDHDGKLDLAITNASGHSVSVLLGTGGGAFAAQQQIAVGASTPRVIQVADLDTDGHLDLVVANWGSSNVSVLRGTGAGTFGAATQFAAGQAPRALAIADYSGDGKLDVAVANNQTSQVRLLVGTGTGALAAPVVYGVGVSPVGLGTGDFNADGRPDLAVANADSNNVSIMLGTATGTFTFAAALSAAYAYTGVLVGDFNRDGSLDVVVVQALSASVKAFLGAGDGTFSAGTVFGVGMGPVDSVQGDFNADGTLDVAVVDGAADRVNVLLGN